MLEEKPVSLISCPVQVKLSETIGHHSIHINGIQCLKYDSYAIYRNIIRIGYLSVNRILSDQHPITGNQQKHHVVKYSFHIYRSY